MAYTLKAKIKDTPQNPPQRKALKIIGWAPALFIALALASYTALASGPAGTPLAATTPTPAVKPASWSVSGVVTEAEEPVAGAVVRLQLTDNQTLSGEDGAFTLTNLAAADIVTITAWAKGYYVGWANARPDSRPITITLKPHYTTDNTEYDWFSFKGVEGSAACALCHTANPEWAADAHAQAAINPRFLTLYEGTDVDGNQSPLTDYTNGIPQPPDPNQPYYGPGYKLDNPNRSGNCATCHTPQASTLEPDNTCGWSGCHTDVTAARSKEVPFGVAPTDLTGVAAEGIGCDFCHKIGEVYLDPETGLPWAAQPGISSMRLYRPAEGEELFFGPFDDIPRRDTYLPLQEESAICAPCHYGVFGGVAGSQDVTGGVVVYNSFGEWLDSPYSDPETGQTCQDCHMPPVENDYFVFPDQGGLSRDYKPVHNHQMPGAADEELLQNSVTMTTTAKLVDDEVVVEVSLTNTHTGHHVPTGVPLRHLILWVQAADAAGEPLPRRTGPVLPTWTGDYAGQAGQYYAKILKDKWTGAAPTAAYWREIELVEDTRLAAYATDVNRFSFAAPPGGPITVEVQLVFRRAFQELMEQKGWTDPDIVIEQAEMIVSAP